ncbi:MAG: hypothetical protein RBU25_14255 [Lentisphaeria bacterium]|jgi:hypothetical protein|nr:hypothetical protein [Lentisphaeria bacterium]
MRFTSFRLLLLVLALAVSCRPPSAEREVVTSGKGNLAGLVGRQLGSPDAPVRVVSFLPVIDGCQDVIGEYLAAVAEKYPAVFQVRILAMKSPEGRELMAAHEIRCAAVMVNGETTFDLGGEDGKFILEGPMDPRDVVRALAAAARAAVGDRAPELPEPPEIPGIDKMPKRTF